MRTASAGMRCVVAVCGSLAGAAFACTPFGTTGAGPSDAAVAVAADAAAVPSEGGPDSSPAPPTYRDAVLADHPLAYYRLDDREGTVAADSSGNHHDATYIGVVGLGRPGVIAQDPDTEISLDDPNACVTTPGDVLATGGAVPFTFEAWIQPTVIDSNYRNIFKKGSNSDEHSFELFVIGGAGPALGLQRHVDEVCDLQQVDLVPPPVGAITHVVATYDGLMLALYVNGVLRGTGPDNRTMPTDSTPLYIGCSGVGGNPFIGALDEIAIYDMALPVASIQHHYAVGTGHFK